MSSRTSIQQVVSIEAPAGATLGDEWYNPTTGVLLKRMLAGGVVGWTTILISSSTITSLPSLSITNNTAATSATTGALQVVGGVGIGGDLYINGNVALGTLSESLTRLAYASTNNSKLLVRPSFDINASGTITAADATAFNNVLIGVTAVNSSTVNRLPFVLQHFDNTATGVMVLPQTILGYSVGSTIYSGQIFLTASLNNNIKHFLRVGDDIADTAGVRIKATITLVGTGTDATSTTTGALQVLGGVGISGTLYIGGLRGDATTSATTYGIYYNTATKELTTATAATGGGGAATQVQTVLQTASANYYPTFVSANNASATAMSVYTTSSFVINPQTGYHGIGTSAPRANLDVADGNPNVSGDALTIVGITGPTAGIGTGLLTIQSNNSFAADKGGSIAFGGRYGSAFYGITTGANWAFINGYKETATDASLAGYLQFQTRNAAGTITERLRITSLGYVGVGYTSTQRGETLGVLGGAYVSGTVTATTFVGAFTGAVTGAATQVNTVLQTASASYYPTFVDSNNASATGELVYTTSTFIINPSTGQVGINTTFLSTSSKLVVAGRVESITDPAGEGGQFTMRSPGYGYRWSIDNYYGAMRIIREDDVTEASGLTIVTITSGTSNVFVVGGTAGYAGEKFAVNGGAYFNGVFTATSAQITTGLSVGATAPSATAGEIRATNEITAYYSSDARLKENVRLISDPITMLEQIRGVYFDWTAEHIKMRGGEDGYFVRKHDIGVIAQEIEAVLPEIVATRDNGYKAVKYEKIVPLLIEAIKAQQRQIDQILGSLETLTNK